MVREPGTLSYCPLPGTVIKKKWRKGRTVAEIKRDTAIDYIDSEK